MQAHKKKYWSSASNKVEGLLTQVYILAMNVCNLLYILLLKKLKHKSLSATVERVIFFTYLRTYDGVAVSSHLVCLLTCCSALLAFPSLPHSQVNFSPKLAKLEYVPFLYIKE